MNPQEVIKSPKDFIVREYQPGLLIDFKDPPPKTDLDVVRESLTTAALSIPHASKQHVLDTLDESLKSLQVGSAEDFCRGVLEYSDQGHLDAGLEVTLRKFGIDPAPMSLLARVRKVVEISGVLDKPAHFPASVYCHIAGDETHFDATGTTFGFVLSGNDCRVQLNGDFDRRVIPLCEGSYFCIPGSAILTGTGRVELITRHDWIGFLSIGSSIESWGRLKYIDGCTDSMLVAPPRRGDPCLNSLYFPRDTKQTAHTHPSMRTGLVWSGQGVCKTPSVDYELKPGNIFFLPPETWHSFHTEPGQPEQEQAALTVIAFHPDSDTGPTDEDHAMLNRTYFKFSHRLKSIERSLHSTFQAALPREGAISRD